MESDQDNKPGLPPTQESPASHADAMQPTEARLPEDFFQKLLNLPACKTIGKCNGCGRCEH